MVAPIFLSFSFLLFPCDFLFLTANFLSHFRGAKSLFFSQKVNEWEHKENFHFYLKLCEKKKRTND